jgi:hypothetical protein
VAGGYAVTIRMLAMFKPSGEPAATPKRGHSKARHVKKEMAKA